MRGLAGASLAGAAAGCVYCPRHARGKVRLAAVGIWGKGFTDWMPMVKSGWAELVALCDCDRDTLARVASNKEFRSLGIDINRIRFFDDYRRLLDDAGILGIDAMTVSTTDHTHAPIAIRAMQQGIHCFVQKPLVRTLWELDYFRKTAKDYGVVTQMGNQGSSMPGFRRAVEVLRSGILGDVREVHVWTNRPVWPQGRAAEEMTRGPADKVPQNLNWDAWLATARNRPYKGAFPVGAKVHNPWNIAQTVYHPFNWRGYFDFGCGAFGDMACHTMNLAFRGLELGAVKEAERLLVEDPSDIAYPMKSTVKLVYAARGSKARPGVKLPEVELYWYDGDQRPPLDRMPSVLAAQGALPRTGCAIVGSKGVLYSANDYGGESYVALEGERSFAEVREHEACLEVERKLPIRGDSAAYSAKGPGAAAVSADGHYLEFLDAIMGDGPVFAETKSRCFSDVGHSIPMMESILVGVTAQRVPGKLAWNSAKQTFDNKTANALMRPYIRKGYEF